jgi:hypothetical protein
MRDSISLESWQLFFMHVWLLVFAAVRIRRRLTHKPLLPFGAWAQFALLGCMAALFCIPYDFWQLTTLEVAGPGQDAGGQLTVAVDQNHRYLVKAFLRSGVAVDSVGQNGETALDHACLTGQVEMARFLVYGEAQLDLAPACRKCRSRAALKPFLNPQLNPQRAMSCML